MADRASQTTPGRLPLRIHGDGGPGTMAHGEVEDVLRWAKERGLDVRATTDGKAVAQVGLEPQAAVADARVDRVLGYLRRSFAVSDLRDLTWFHGEEPWWRERVKHMLEAADAE